MGVSVSASTPVAIPLDPYDHAPSRAPTVVPDPLDGRPEDQPRADHDAPSGLDELPIVRSGRSRDAPDSSVAYDGNGSTAWPAGELENRWIWFDLGEPVRIRLVRWLATGSGSVTIDVSDDRETWQEVGDSSLANDWVGIDLRENARYVRLTFSDDATEDTSLVEFAAYGMSPDRGTGGNQSVELAQEREQRAQDRRSQRDRGQRRAQKARVEATGAPENESGADSGSGASVSTKPGKTKCKGDKAKCQAREGKTRVDEDCTSEGTCVIDVRADGGTAICDATGGDKNETGQGEGKQPGRGGRCEAIADGGTVTIGDINP